MNRRQHLIGEEESGRVLFLHAREKYDKIISDCNIYISGETEKNSRDTRIFRSEPDL